ncbi:hypothetical protein SARC_05674 [Sphaeroforma arctica JP610]|uniref:Uncharacterized protein n=1 Tax=Sphaeroforma arctica JP610 TaxID=667725 RepID=A0A0L0FYW8_9EUKA|nr:hypothetical protein SARC_05674 [Sphaeroforma arctica JP610]KNC82037.1 hypothetical protein SARC_05674 [Sphaeroforma arctica JP610]|eukprot:XP_014155939.1 hypothetical protein SARC_05674 [Sphaeroforma arctica JP610]
MMNKDTAAAATVAAEANKTVAEGIVASKIARKALGIIQEETTPVRENSPDKATIHESAKRDQGSLNNTYCDEDTQK